MKGATTIMSDSNEVLVVASKIKTYIKSKGDMKTSASVLEALSDRIRRMCDDAIEGARNDGRKTVLDRDIP
jgi:histone H3/H4